MHKSGRLPQAPASLLVQLPPDELKKLQASRNDGDRVSSSLGGIQGESVGVQASDLNLLATSIQQRREREERVFTWQQRLIDADEELSREELKRAVSYKKRRSSKVVRRSSTLTLFLLAFVQLTQLSLSSWLQVLQERHLDRRCAYPSCSRKPKKPHLSERDTNLPLDAPRYRISLSTRTIQRDERDDPGGENAYCTKACWRRGEWVSRWVLEGSSASRRESERRAMEEKKEFGSVIQDHSEGLGNQVDKGGRWERLIEEDHWEKVELLEDLEDAGEVDRLSDDESIQRHSPSDRAAASTTADRKTIPTPESKPVEVTPQRIVKDNLDDFSSMLDSLAIVERPSEKLNKVKIIPPKHEEQSRKVRVRLIDRSGDKEEIVKLEEEEEETRAEVSDADSDDMDVLGELSMRSGVEGESDIASTILASSRNLQRVDMEDENSSTKELSEEELKQRQEEDDLFALAWQARDEEKAKGSWVD